MLTAFYETIKDRLKIIARIKLHEINLIELYIRFRYNSYDFKVFLEEVAPVSYHVMADEEEYYGISRSISEKSYGSSAR
jgi:hypothetical protein